MNEYMINTGFSRVSVTAANEKDARRIYRENTTAEEKHFKDIAVELIRENVPATKQQEREALEKIKAIVATLGPRSYVGTALDGCLVDAEVNIENDFGDSMKARWLHADAQLNAAKGTIEELEAQKRSMQETINRLQQENAEAEARRVTETDLVHLIRLAEEDLAEAEQRRDAAAQDIVTYAGDPACEEFRQAVAAHRNATSSVEAKKERLSRLNIIRNAG